MPVADATRSNGQTRPERPSNLLLFRRFLGHRRDPQPFLDAMAQRAMADLGRDVSGERILDLGCGSGADLSRLRDAGADAVGLDINLADLRGSDGTNPRIVGDGGDLPLATASFDGVYCSNVLEHTPRPDALFAEIARVLKPGGWAWVSWTNWYSPVGGHEIIGLNYLGPRLGVTLWTRLFGRPRINEPYVGLWPTRIDTMLDTIGATPGLRLVDAHPRYYPSQRWILRVPVLREVATWNCVLDLTTEPAS